MKTRTHLRVGTATSIVISSGIVLVHVDSRWVIQEEKTRQKPIALSRVTRSTSRCDLSRRPPIGQSPFCQGATRPFIFTFTMPKPQAVTMHTDETMRASLRDAIPASQLLSQDDAGMYRSMGVDPPKNSKPPPYGGRPKFVKFIAGDKGENLPHVFYEGAHPSSGGRTLKSPILYRSTHFEGGAWTSRRGARLGNLSCK